MQINILGDLFFDDNQSIQIGSEVESFLFSSNLNIINLEAPIINNNLKKYKIKKAGPNIYMNNNVIKQLNKLNIKLVTLANNHIMDYGKEGVNNTFQELKKENIKSIGAGKKEEAYNPYIINIGNKKIGIFNIGDNEFGGIDEHNSYGYASINNEFLLTIGKKIKKVDFPVIIIHAGVELMPFPNLYQKNLYRQLIDIGFKIVIGHHPHIIQGYEHYNNGDIFYSLGNFYFSNYSEKTPKSRYNLGIKLRIKENLNYTIDIIKLSNEGNNIKIINNKFLEKYLENINNIITNKNEFKKYNIIQSQYLFENVYSKYIKYIYGRPIIKKIRQTLRKERGELNIEESILLYHLYRNECHRYNISCALNNYNYLESNITKKFYKLLEMLNG